MCSHHQLRASKVLFLCFYRIGTVKCSVRKSMGSVLKLCFCHLICQNTGLKFDPPVFGETVKIVGFLHPLQVTCFDTFRRARKELRKW